MYQPRTHTHDTTSSGVVCVSPGLIHLGTVPVAETKSFVLIVLVSCRLELLLYTGHTSNQECKKKKINDSDFTLTHTCFGKSQLSSLGQLTHTRRTDGAHEPDGTLRTVTRAKIRHYRQLYINHPEPISFMSVVVDTMRPYL